MLSESLVNIEVINLWELTALPEISTRDQYLKNHKNTMPERKTNKEPKLKFERGRSQESSDLAKG